MDEETKARFDDVSAALGTINAVLAEIIEGMATKAQFDAAPAQIEAGDQGAARRNHGADE